MDCNRARVELDYAIHRGVVAPLCSLSLSLSLSLESSILEDRSFRRKRKSRRNDSFKEKSLWIQIVRIGEEIYTRRSNIEALIYIHAVAINGCENR